MRHRALIMALSILLMMIPSSAASAYGPVPGCPPAKHVTNILGPWDGGPWYFPRWGSDIKPLRLAILHVWYNLNDPDIINDPRNPGQPSWGQTEFKVRISPNILQDLGGKKARMIGMGGEAWIYTNNSACRRNLPIEFRNGDFPIVSFRRLVELGLAKVYN